MSLSEVGFSSQDIAVKGNSINYVMSASNPLGDGVITISGAGGSYANVTDSSEGNVVASDSLGDAGITFLNDGRISYAPVSTERSEILIKEKEDDDTGILEVYVSDNDTGNFNTKIGETSAEGDSDDPGTPGEPGFKAFLGQTGVGEYYEYNATELNNDYLAYQINPALPSAKMYQQFLDSGCKVVALKDGAKGYLDYNGAATASLLAQMQGTAFDINAYLRSGGAAVYGEVVSNVRVVNADGSLIY